MRKSNIIDKLLSEMNHRKRKSRIFLKLNSMFKNKSTKSFVVHLINEFLISTPSIKTDDKNVKCCLCGNKTSKENKVFFSEKSDKFIDDRCLKEMRKWYKTIPENKLKGKLRKERLKPIVFGDTEDFYEINKNASVEDNMHILEQKYVVKYNLK